MLITKLSADIKDILQNADEVWIATAMINDAGLEFLQSTINSEAIQHYLIGIDLPTTVSALKKLNNLSSLNKSIVARICHTKSGIFHPKMYLVRKSDTYRAYIGSANLTMGGLEKNDELGIEISDLLFCMNLLIWFREKHKTSYPINEKNIQEYENKFNQDRTSYEQLERSSKSLNLINDIGENKYLVGIDFSDQYFKKEHHLAFRPELFRDASKKAENERKLAHRRFLDLHEDIFPKFKEFGIEELDTNTANHIVSMYYHFEGKTNQDLNAMWLSYGKSKNEIKEYYKLFPSEEKYSKNDEDNKVSFINHARLQIRIDINEIGIWLLFGKNNDGSLFDRNHFFEKMKTLDNRLHFYQMITNLPDDYRITVNQKTFYVPEFTDSEMLYNFCKLDNPKHYFIIGRDYEIGALEMSESLLPTTVLTEFKRLYPIYRFMRHYL